MSQQFIYEIQDLDQLFSYLGQTWLQAYLQVIIFPLTGTLGFVFSIISFLVLLDTRVFESNLFAYIRVYSLNNAALSLVSTFYFMPSAFRLLPWTNSYSSLAWFNYIYIPVGNLTFFYSGLLNVLIQLDRVSIFVKVVKQKWTRLARPYTFCLVGFLVCLIINSPVTVIYQPTHRVYLVNQTYNFTIWLSEPNPYTNGLVGTIFSYLVYATREVMLMIMEVILNVTTLICLREHIAKKKRMVSDRNGDPQHSGNESKEAKVTLMACVLCLIAIIQHVLTLACLITAKRGAYRESVKICLTSSYLAAFKPVLDIFVLFVFNVKFRKAISSLFPIK